MSSIQATFTPQTVTRLGKVTKANVRAALKAEREQTGDVFIPEVILSPITGPFQTVTYKFTTLDDVARGKGIEVSDDQGRFIMWIEVHPSGAVVVR